jgi:endonuclease-3 related protein
MARFGGSIEEMACMEVGRLRKELLDIPGIGPETADTILLYALGKPVFVIDAYTRRILANHGLIDPKIGYDELKGLFEANLEPDVRLFKEFHAYFVLTGKNFCRKRPVCSSCPLESFLEWGYALDSGLKENKEKPCLLLPS